MSRIHEFYTKFQNWLGIAPITSNPFWDEEDEELVRQLLAAKDEKEEESVLEKMFTKMEQDNPTEFSEEEYITEEDLPYWLKEHSEESPLRSLPELKLDDEWVEDGNTSKFTNYLAKFVAIVAVISALSSIIFGIIGYDRMSLAVAMLFFLILAVLVVTESVKFFGRIKVINRNWQKFAELYRLGYEINKDNRFMGGEYQGHHIVVGTHNIDSKLRTQVMVSHLRISPDTQVTISTYGKFDKFRKLLEGKGEVKLGGLEKRFKIITQPKHLTYAISDSTILCQRLLKIEAHQAKIKIEVMDKDLFYEQAKPLDKVENWQYLLNTLCILVRAIERTDK